MRENLDEQLRRAFAPIEAEEPMRQQAVRAVRAAAPAKHRRHKLRLAFGCLVLALVVLAGGGWYRYLDPSARVVVQADVPVELAVNRADRVIAVQADGSSELLTDLDLKGNEVGEACSLLYAALAERGQQPQVTVHCNDSQRRQQLQRRCGQGKASASQGSAAAQPQGSQSSAQKGREQSCISSGGCGQKTQIERRQGHAWQEE